MPRGRRKLTFEKIEEIDALIAEYQAKIEGLEQKKEGMLKKQQEKELQNIYVLMQEQNLSIDDLKNIIIKETNEE